MKIIVGMSGGVDSTIAAYILKKAGHEVVGVNFNFVGTSPIEGTDVESPLKEISKRLGIKVITRDYHEEFREKIIASFVHDYENGITPNPCALCNATMKFAKLLEVMKEERADMVATGHYANICISKSADEIVSTSEIHKSIENNTNELYENHRKTTNEKRECEMGVDCKPTYCIKKSSNQQKDQSYMLYRLTQEVLSHIILPLGNMDKSEVRKIAEDLKLPNAATKDSQDVCFIQSVKTIKDNINIGMSSPEDGITTSQLNYKEFIKQFELGYDYKDKIAKGILSKREIDSFSFLKKGEFVDTKGKVLGFHNGIINYTVGQRRGINIAFGDRRFVVKIDVEKNQVVLGTNEELMSTDFKIYDVVFSGLNPLIVKNDNKKVTYIAKLRYRHEGTMCDIDLSTMTCKLHSPVRAITPGQAAVFYDEKGQVMFGGWITL